MSAADAPNRLLRHGGVARIAHGLNAVATLVLLATGLALGDWLAPRLVAWMGGHLVVNAVHQKLGLAAVIALALLGVALRRRVARLLAAVRPLRRGDGRWTRSFMRFWWRGDAVAPFHDGRFDPLQRWVFALLILALVVTGLSGVYLYFLPPWGRIALVWAIRSHVAAAWVLLVLVAFHMAVGIGLPRTHRGLARAMFGDGTVSSALARRLWPGWAARQTRVATRPGATDR